MLLRLEWVDTEKFRIGGSVPETDIGTIESPVKIPAGCASTRSILRSSGSSGTATVKAEAEYRKIVKLEGSTTVEFLDAESK